MTPQRIYDSAAWTGRPSAVSFGRFYVVIDDVTAAPLPLRVWDTGHDWTDWSPSPSAGSIEFIPQDILDIPDGFGA